MVSIKTPLLVVIAVALVHLHAAHAQTSAPAQPTFAPLSAEDRGDLFMARKMFREAIAVYKTGPQNSPVIWNKIGIAWHNLGELSLARTSYEHALRVDKKYAEAVNNIGTVFYAQKKYRTAINRYKRAIELAPDKASFWSNLGTAYYSQGKFPLMMEAYDKAIALDPDIFEHRGVAGTQMQERTVADRARYHFELARLYARLGKDELAIQYLRHSFEEGFKDKDKVRKSPEFAGMLENPEFIEVMALDPRVL
jgi:tetratricopeptide (TPR) repeat protein